MMWFFVYNLMFVTTNVECAKILGIFHEKSFSHQQLGNKLLFELSSRNHDVTILTTVVPKSPPKNITFIKLDLDGHATDSGADLFELANHNIFKTMSMINSVELLWTEAVIKNINTQKLLQSNKTFDAIIMEQLGNHALKAFCHHYNAQCIMLSTMGSTSLSDEQMGNPFNPSYVPYRFLNYPPEMNFYQRFYNSYITLIATLNFHFVVLPNQNALMQRYFPNAPHLKDLMYNISLMLVNSHYSTSVPVANVPNVIEIGGFHIDSPKELPVDVKNFLNDAEDGAIYFNMGSILKSKLMDGKKVESILNVFRKLKQRILWKFEDASLDLPPNVKVVKWIQQTDVLKHPNVRVFVTHGGLLSTTEAICFGVPIVGIPIFADQGLNVALAEHLGYGIAVSYQELNEETFGNALDKVLNNRSFTDVAVEKAKIFHDQPMKPLDKAIFWVEYCIRHNGASHLRSSALNLDWYQYLLLDVFISTLLVVLITIFIIWAIVRKLCKRCYKTKKE